MTLYLYKNRQRLQHGVKFNNSCPSRGFPKSGVGWLFGRSVLKSLIGRSKIFRLVVNVIVDARRESFIIICCGVKFPLSPRARELYLLPQWKFVCGNQTNNCFRQRQQLEWIFGPCGARNALVFCCCVSVRAR